MARVHLDNTTFLSLMLYRGTLKAIEFIDVHEGAGRISNPKPLRLREYYLVSPELGLFKKVAILSRISDHPFSALIRRYRNIRLVHVWW